MKFTNFLLLIALIILAFSCSEDLGTSSNDSKKYEFTIYSTETCNIPSDVVYAMDIIDSTVWIGTSGGYSRLENGTWHNSYPAQRGWPANTVYDINALADGTIWIGGRESLSRTGYNVWESYDEICNVRFYESEEIICDSRQRIWISFFSETNYNFLYTRHFVYLEGDSFINQTQLNPIGFITSFALTPAGDILIAGARNFALFKNSVWQETIVPYSIEFQQITKMACSKTGDIWFATTEGFLKYDGSSWQSYPPPPNMGAMWVVKVDDYGTVWAGFNESFGSLTGSDWTIYDSNNSNFSSGTVSDIIFDGNDAVWVSTVGSGVFKIDRSLL